MSSVIAKMSKLLTDPAYALEALCHRYLNHRNRHSYDFFKNGESDLLAKVATIRPEIVFDVGANVGDWSSIAHDLFPQATVHCFELSERTFSTLTRNISGAHFVLNNAGLSDKLGIFDYKDYGPDSGVNTLLLNATVHDQKIQPTLVKANLLTGNYYCRDHMIEKIDFLKIDVEGAEHLVLRGFSNLLEHKAVRIIQFEYGYTNGDSKFLMRDFYQFFKDYGYTLARVQKGPLSFREWTYSDNDFKSGPNYVAIRADDTQVLQLLSH